MRCAYLPHQAPSSQCWCTLIGLSGCLRTPYCTFKVKRAEGLEIKRDFEVAEMKTCAGECERDIFSSDETRCLCCDPHASCHDSPCIGDVSHRMETLLFLWQTSAVYKKCIDWTEWDLLTSTSFLISPSPLRVSAVPLVIGNAAEPPRCEGQRQFRPGWVIKWN